eukprot:8191927-Karenia_brevis.AAC.1
MTNRTPPQHPGPRWPHEDNAKLQNPRDPIAQAHITSMYSLCHVASLPGWVKVRARFLHN